MSAGLTGPCTALYCGRAVTLSSLPLDSWEQTWVQGAGDLVWPDGALEDTVAVWSGDLSSRVGAARGMWGLSQGGREAG